METNAKKQEPAAGSGGFNVALADVANYDWEAAITTAEHPICFDYYTLLFEKSSQLAKAGDEKGQSVFRFLGSVASLALREEDDQPPFAPFVVMHDRRSMALKDQAFGSRFASRPVTDNPDRRDACTLCQYPLGDPQRS